MSDIGDFFKDVEKTVSDIGKSVEKATSDVWKSDAGKIIVPAVIGFAVGGPVGAAAGVKTGAVTGAVAGAGMGYSSVQQKKAVKEAEKMQATQIAAQKEMQEKQIELETLKMEEAKQLMDQYAIQDKPFYPVPSDITKPAPIKAPANYLLYIAIGIGILIYLGKIKL